MRFRGQLAARPLIAFIAASLCALGLSACSSGPLADITSLSPAIQGDAVNDNDAFVEASDQILLTNILRARDRAPLNMGALASMSGALSLSGTAGFTIPFGSKPAMSSGNSFAPSITGSTSPTYTFTPLNTEGFELNILQPVSATYVLSRWNAGISRELLLLLFVKEIDFPVKVPSSDPDNSKKVVHYVRYINNPDDQSQFDTYLQLVRLLLRSNAALKSFDIMDPAGPMFDMYSPLNLSAPTGGTAPSKDNDMSIPLQPNSTAFGAITGNSDGQYHFGNVPNSPNTKNSPLNRGQIYRVYAGQVALCINAHKMKEVGFRIPVAHENDVPSSTDMSSLIDVPTVKNVIPETSTPAVRPRHETRRQTSNNPVPIPSGTLPNLELDEQFDGVQVMQAYAASALSSPSSSSTGGGTGTKSSSPASSSSSGGGASQATTAALQAQRVSSIINDDGCGPGEIVLKQTSEDKFSLQSQGFVHIQWRSIAEIFEYLGAVLRMNRSNSEAVHWTEPADSWTAVNNEAAKDVKARAGKNFDNFCGPSDDCAAHVLFDLSEDGPGYLSVSYRNSTYRIPDDSFNDETKTVLSMLSSLVNIANVSSGITPTTPLQLLPLP